MMNTPYILESALTVFLFMNLMFLLALRLKDNSIVDIGWGIGFILIAGLGFWRHADGVVPLAVLVMTTLWGARLAGYIYLRSRGKGEDFRYAKWREQWGNSVVWRSYLQVFMLQGIIMLLVASPLFSVFSCGGDEVNWMMVVGIILWAVGFLFEAVSDGQMMRFKSDPANKGRIMQNGLWRYSRHPNYFGEALLWWGIGLAGFSTELWYLSFAGPGLLTFLLLRVSGVAMLERKYVGNPDYQSYVETTRSFIPWFPKTMLERKDCSRETSN